MHPVDDALREPLRNALLRHVDWRFLLHQVEQPRTFDLSSGRLSRAVRMVSDGHIPEQGSATLVVLDRISVAGLSKAWAVLRPGGEVYCESRVPAIAGPARARRRLARAGFADVQILWRWPPAGRGTPQFWLPLDSPVALRQFLALRPARSRAQVIVRRVWQIAAATGALAPLRVVARRPAVPSAAVDERDELAAVLPCPRSWLLVTGGRRSINKVAGLPFGHGDQIPSLIVKFARVPEAEPGLEHEAAVLRELEHRHPDVPGIPRVVAVGRRAGRLALAETAIHGQPLLASLTEASFSELALKVTRWLAGLAESGGREPGSEWWSRLIAAPLEELERHFGDVAGARTIAWARGRLEGLGELPQACEHRDCSPWNIVLTDGGAVALLDWESAEPLGLPGLDLVYFLANAVFVLEGALEAGRTRQAYARLLDPGTGTGRVAARCLAEYCERLDLDRGALDRLRLLCWIIHCRSDYRHLALDGGGPPGPGALRQSVFLGLIQEEFRRAESEAAGA